jgi:hypothetical protein
MSYIKEKKKRPKKAKVTQSSKRNSLTTPTINTTKSI